MTDSEKRAVRILSYVTFLPASYDKRFYKNMAERLHNEPDKPLTEKQSALLSTMVHRYRRQHKACNCLECFNKAAKKDNPAQTKLFEEWQEVER